jgi:hypothetical protein
MKRRFLMKKIVLMVSVISIIVLSLTLFSTRSVEAFFIPTVKPEVWDTGTEYPLDLTTTPPPNEWLQALSRGVEVTEPGTICHPFRKGPFGWTGSIYQLVDDTWVKLPTTLAWIPDEEGVFTACAVAPAPGKYAFFGYYDQALAPVVKKTEPPK